MPKYSDHICNIETIAWTLCSSVHHQHGFYKDYGDRPHNASPLGHHWYFFKENTTEQKGGLVARVNTLLDKNILSEVVKKKRKEEEEKKHFGPSGNLLATRVGQKGEKGVS